MTVPSEIDRSGPYYGNGVTKTFPYKFRIVHEAHISVVMTTAAGHESKLVLNSDYTVTSVGAAGGGDIILTNPLPSGYSIVNLRGLPFTQETDLENQGAYYAETVEDALDLAAMRDQQLKEGLDRSLKAPVTDGGVDMTLPSKEARANRYLSFGDDGRPTATTFDVEAAQRAAETAVSSASTAVSAAARSVSAANTAANDVRLLVKDDADRASSAADRSERAADQANQRIEQYTPTVLRFSGDDETTEFDLGIPGLDEKLTNVFISGVYQQKDTYEVVNGVLTFSPAPPAGDDNIEVNVGGTSAMAFAVPSKNTVGRNNLTGKLRDTLTVYQEGEDLRSLAVNGVSEVGGNFPRSPTEELRDAFSGGNPDGALPLQAATDLGECLIIPPTEDSTNYVFATVPWLVIDGTARRIMPVDIRTNLFNSPLNIPLFEPVRVNGFGMLSFRYIGDEPIHTVLKGSVSVLVRTSATRADPYARHIFRLSAVNPPHMEYGENSGRRNLAGPIGSWGNAQRISDYYEFNDECFPIDQALLDMAANLNWPNRFVGSQNGFFNSGDTTEALRTSDDLGVVGPEVRTTNWMDVSSDDKLAHAYFFDCGGTSTRRRIQIKTASGQIKTFTPLTRQSASARVVYRLPTDAAFVRIYYSGRGDTASGERFIRIAAVTSPEYDPLKGYWDMRTFNVCRDVTFWPGVEYFFDLFTQVYDGATARDWGFRFQSGGLTFLFDAGRIRKKLAAKLFKEA